MGSAFAGSAPPGLRTPSAQRAVRWALSRSSNRAWGSSAAGGDPPGVGIPGHSTGRPFEGGEWALLSEFFLLGRTSDLCVHIDPLGRLAGLMRIACWGFLRKRFHILRETDPPPLSLENSGSVRSTAHPCSWVWGPSHAGVGGSVGIGGWRGVPRRSRLHSPTCLLRSLGPQGPHVCVQTEQRRLC